MKSIERKHTTSQPAASTVGASLTSKPARPVGWHAKPDGLAGALRAPQASLTQAQAPTSAPEIVRGQADRDERFFQALERSGLALHSAQCAAVRHAAGPLLCLAGAGSGKTSVLTARAAYLLAVRDIAPEALWLVTFTSKAAAEMRERLGRLPGVGPAKARRVQARTFHSFALRLLQAYAPPFQLFAEERARHGFMSRVIRELRLQDSLQAETVLAALSALKARGEKPSLAPSSARSTSDAGITQLEKDIQRAMVRFEEQKQARGLKDFDDLLIDTLALLENDQQLVAKLARRFQYVMVDEYQDTTPIQLQLLRHITDQHHNLAVFGDDDQTIYTFNGANHRYITGFKDMYPDAVQITLDRNYRSTPAIVGLGNAVIRHNQERLEKTMMAVQDSHSSRPHPAPVYLRPADAEQEAELITKRIRELVEQEGRRYSDIAVLYRTGNASRALIEHLTMSGLPFIQYGAEPLFYDHALVKPLIDHMRLALQPRDFDALGSVVAALYVSRDVGMSHITRLEQERAKKYPLVHLTTCPNLAPFQQEAIKPRIRYLKKLATMKPYYAIRDMRREFYDKYTTAMSGEKATNYQEAAAETLEELESSAKRFETITDFLAHIEALRALQQNHNRDSNMTASDNHANEDRITCLTIHRAKGLEYPCVFLLGITEQLLPHRSSLKEKPPAEKEASARFSTESHQGTGMKVEEELLQDLLEEERRLLYVAITRAKEQLFISSPALLHGQKQEISRFLIQAWQPEDTLKC